MNGVYNMKKTISSFKDLFRYDRQFRMKILSAWKAGNLTGALLEQGFTFSPEQLGQGLPQVRTGIRAGGCANCSPCGCGSE